MVCIVQPRSQGCENPGNEVVRCVVAENYHTLPMEGKHKTKNGNAK